MGVSINSQKDSKANTDQELGLRVKPIHKEDCTTSKPEDHHHNRMIIALNILSVHECDHDHQEEEQNQLDLKFNNIIGPSTATPPSSPDLQLKKLKILSPYKVLEKNDNDDDGLNDGFKTPTSLDHKIPPMLECPGAPRKKIMRMSPTMKPRMKRRLMFDPPKEVESMFIEDLNSAKNKKLKNCMLLE